MKYNKRKCDLVPKKNLTSIEDLKQFCLNDTVALVLIVRRPEEVVNHGSVSELHSSLRFALSWLTLIVLSFHLLESSSAFFP